MGDIKLIGNGVDTLIQNVRYTDENNVPIQRELDEGLQNVLDSLQGSARLKEGRLSRPGCFWVWLRCSWNRTAVGNNGDDY